MARKPKTPDITSSLTEALREETTGTDPVIDGDERALTAFLRRSGVKSASHSIPALARLVVDYLRHRKRH